MTVNHGRTLKFDLFWRGVSKGMMPVRWMAPESLVDGLFTPMTDIWSYGVLLFEIITFGSFPFQGLSNNQVLEHVKSGMTVDIPVDVKPQLSVSFLFYLSFFLSVNLSVLCLWRRAALNFCGTCGAYGRNEKKKQDALPRCF